MKKILALGDKVCYYMLMTKVSREQSGSFDAFFVLHKEKSVKLNRAYLFRRIKSKKWRITL